MHKKFLLFSLILIFLFLCGCSREIIPIISSGNGSSSGGGNVSADAPFNSYYYTIAQDTGIGTGKATITANVLGWSFPSSGVSQLGNTNIVYHETITPFYSFKSGTLNANNVFSVERDGTFVLIGDASTFNTIQQQFLLSNWVDSTPRWNSDFWGYVLNRHESTFFNFIMPCDLKQDTHPMIRIHFVDLDHTCYKDFIISYQILSKCETLVSNVVTPRGECKSSNDNIHDIFSGIMNDRVYVDNLVQIKVERDDDCGTDVVMTNIDIMYEQDTLGCRSEEVK